MVRGMATAGVSPQWKACLLPAALGEGLWSSHCIWDIGSDDWPSWHRWPNSVAWEERKGQGGLLEKVSMEICAGHTKLWLPSPLSRLATGGVPFR